jgi:cytochrome c2
VVERMNRRMQMMSRHGMMMMGRAEAPTEKELAEIIDYLQSHAQKPLPTRLMPDLESPAGKAFHAACSQCHTLPDPGQHTAEEWPAVVERMKGYMASMGKAVPDEKELGEIVGFLQRHGRKQD